MLNKDRYDFDTRFNSIAEKILTMNGTMPGHVGDTNIDSKPTNFEQYQMQSDPDYQLLKQGNFMIEPSSQNVNGAANGYGYPNQQNFTPGGQYQPNYYPMNQSQMFNPNQNYGQNNMFHSPQIQQNKKQNIRQFVNSLDRDELDKMLEKNVNTIKKGKDNILIRENLDPNQDQQGPVQENNNEQMYNPQDKLKRNASVPLATGEMILMQQKMFEQLQQQQLQFQQEMMMRQQEQELQQRRRKQRKQQEQEMQQTLEPILKSQQQLMESLLKKINEQKEGPPPKTKPNIFNEDYLLKELEYKKQLMQQQHEFQVQKMEKERILQQQNLQLQSMMMPAMFNYLSTGNPSAQMNNNPYAQPPGPLGNQFPNFMAPPMGTQQGQTNQIPRLNEMQSLVFNKPKSRGSALIEGFLRDIKK